MEAVGSQEGPPSSLLPSLLSASSSPDCHHSEAGSWEEVRGRRQSVVCPGPVLEVDREHRHGDTAEVRGGCVCVWGGGADNAGLTGGLRW